MVCIHRRRTWYHPAKGLLHRPKRCSFGRLQRYIQRLCTRQKGALSPYRVRSFGRLQRYIQRLCTRQKGALSPYRVPGTTATIQAGPDNVKQFFKKCKKTLDFQRYIQRLCTRQKGALSPYRVPGTTATIQAGPDNVKQFFKKCKKTLDFLTCKRKSSVLWVYFWFAPVSLRFLLFTRIFLRFYKGFSPAF